MLASDITRSAGSFHLHPASRPRSNALPSSNGVSFMPPSASSQVLLRSGTARSSSAALRAPFVDSYVWRLPSDLGPVRSRHLYIWFCDAVAATGFVPPAGFKITSYAARKGMAMEAKSTAVGMEEIQWLGDWAIDPAAVHSYIDLGMRPSLAAHLWFGWLLKQRDVSPPSSDFCLTSTREVDSSRGTVSSAAGGADASPGAVVCLCADAASLLFAKSALAPVFSFSFYGP